MASKHPHVAPIAKPTRHTFKATPRGRHAQRSAQGAAVARPIRDAIRLGCYSDYTGKSARVQDYINSSISHTQVVDVANWDDLIRPSTCNTEFDFRQQVSAAVAFSEAVDPHKSIGLVISSRGQHTDYLFSSKSQENPESILLRSSTFDAARSSKIALDWSRNVRNGQAEAAPLVSPDICIIRDSIGHLVQPRLITVATTPVVGASPFAPEVRNAAGRALYALQEAGVDTVIVDNLGADMKTAAQVWAELLVLSSSPFHGVFGRVIFAIPGFPFEDFMSEFDARKYAEDLTNFLLDDSETFL